MPGTYDIVRQQYQRFLDPKSIGRGGKQEEIRTTPLFSLAVKYAVDHPTDPQSSTSDGHLEGHHSSASCPDQDSEPSNDAEWDPESHTTDDCGSNPQGIVLPEFALLGFNVGDHAEIKSHEPLFMNVNAPNSAFICGSQGSGKSYTLSCMLENCLHPDPEMGRVSSPVAGVVFHYDIDSAGSVAEVAYLCSRGIKVSVLVSPSNERALRAAYKRIPSSADIDVRTLRLQSADLSIERIHKLMAFSEKEGSVPLYMEVAQRILREMAVTSRGAPFNYAVFKAKMAQESFSRDQASPLNLRLNLLESFMDLAKPKKPAFQLDPGTLTIVDLSDPFIDASTVCVLFDICLSLAKENRPPAGLAVVLDEAHKYMGKSAAAANFTDRLLTTIREQRHNATRVFVATQEPTVSEKLLDLCSVAIVHRFTSPAWFAAIKGHLGGASSMVRAAQEDGEVDGDDLTVRETTVFEQIVDLQVGESLVFAPSAYLRMAAHGTPMKMGAAPAKMKTRMRKGVDGGTSVLALR